MKVATNTENDCAEMLNYFRGRSPLSRAVTLSKQVLDSSEKTRGSYLSSTFDKISMFADMSLCALTSENEIELTTKRKLTFAGMLIAFCLLLCCVFGFLFSTTGGNTAYAYSSSTKYKLDLTATGTSGMPNWI